MDFESPDVMKDFPGLYASELIKKSNNGSDYSDDAEKTTKKDNLIGKRKEKKDKKDKERGYAALEGESSAEENYESKSPLKSKKSKSFKFPSKYKEKREKSRDKEKEPDDKKKDKDKKNDKKNEKEKLKSEKKERKSKQDWNNIAEELPIFGVSLELAIERGRCHDEIDLPLPVRACIDYVQAVGLVVEGVYKVSGPKSKVVHIKKMYNHREDVNLAEYDVPTATSVLKLFLRDLPESILTAEMSIRFEEAGAILNVATREKHLKILVNNLPPLNRLLLSWLIVHFYNVTLNEKYTKMNAQNIVVALSPVLQTSQRLLTALICHCPALFENVILEPYIPPLTSTAQLPDELETMEIELRKQESLLNQIHDEMNSGFICKQREELLWEVQRIITQLKRKVKVAHKDKETGTSERLNEKQEEAVGEENRASSLSSADEQPQQSVEDIEDLVDKVMESLEFPVVDDNKPSEEEKSDGIAENAITLQELRGNNLKELKESLLKQIETEKVDIAILRNQLQNEENVAFSIYTEKTSASLDEIMDLLQKENQILQIEKINLVRQIMEQQEMCIDLRAKLEFLSKT